VNGTVTPAIRTLRHVVRHPRNNDSCQSIHSGTLPQIAQLVNMGIVSPESQRRNDPPGQAGGIRAGCYPRIRCQRRRFQAIFWALVMRAKSGRPSGVVG